MLAKRTKGLIAGLLYPVIFVKRLEDETERVVKLILAAKPMGATKSDFLRAIEHALASNAKLSKIVPLPHDEEAVRRYLRELALKLAETTT